MRIGVLGCKGSTLDFLNGLLMNEDIQIDRLVTLPEQLSSGVAYFRGDELKRIAASQGIPVYEVESFKLDGKRDVEFFETAGIDLLLVKGWPRLIPGNVLRKLGQFACGMHGSPYGLPRGRGRASLNWALIQDHTRFMTYLFRYSEKADSGEIIDWMVFDINPFDTVGTLNQKQRIAMQELISRCLPLIESGEMTMKEQPPGKVTFYPKRKPEDGGIDWQMPTRDIYNLIRAVAPPYPGAFCYRNDEEINIEEAFPFDEGLFDHDTLPGTIVDISLALNNFVVKTIDGSLIVKEFDGLDLEELRVGEVLTGIDQEKLLEEVIARYPEHVGEEQMEIKLQSSTRQWLGDRLVVSAGEMEGHRN